jgi:hypothetical protein
LHATLTPDCCDSAYQQVVSICPVPKHFCADEQFDRYLPFSSGHQTVSVAIKGKAYCSSALNTIFSGPGYAGTAVIVNIDTV